MFTRYPPSGTDCAEYFKANLGGIVGVAFVEVHFSESRAASVLRTDAATQQRNGNERSTTERTGVQPQFFVQALRSCISP
jgi:hypothetical protein